MKMPALLFSLGAWALPAATITSVAITNLSTADYANAAKNGQVEFRSGIASYSPPSEAGGFTTLSATLAWVFAARSDIEVGIPALETVHIGYEITLTIQDPANAGYLLGVNSSLAGWHTGLWLSGDAQAIGGHLADFDAQVSRDGLYVNAPVLLLPGGTSTASVDSPEVNDPVTSFASSFGAVIQTGTATYSLRYYSPLAVTGSAGPAGEMALRYGLLPTLDGFTVAGTPGPDGDPASALGLSTEIYMLSFGPSVPEPGSLSLTGGALAALAAAAFRKRRAAGPDRT